MPETVTVGDTEVEITETEDGFEATPVEELSDFGQYVEDEHNHVEVLPDKAFKYEADLDVTTGQPRAVFGSSTGRELDRNDGIEIAYITYGRSGLSDGQSPEEAVLRIGLNDAR